MDVDQVDSDTLMTESTPVSMSDPSVHELSPAEGELKSDETAVVPAMDIEMSDPVSPPSASLNQITHRDNESSSSVSSPAVVEPSSPAVVEPSSPPVVPKTNPRPLIEYISDSEASLSGEDYKISYYEHHHDNFDFSDDEDYVENNEIFSDEIF